MHPTLLHIGHLYLPTFGLVAALGLTAGAYLSLRTARLVAVSPDGLWDAGLFAVLAAFVASRVLLVVLNLKSFLATPILLLMVPSLTGLGLLLAAVAVMVYLRWKRMPLLRVMDAWAAPATLVWAFLAMGHLAEGSDPGLPSRFGLRTSMAGYREQPVALYAAVMAVGLAVGLYLLLRRRWPAGVVAGWGLVMVGVVQFGLTFLRMPYVYGPGSVMVWLDPLQWMAVGMVGVGCLLILWRGGPNAGGSPLRPAAFGRDDGGGRGVLDRVDGASRDSGAKNTGVSPLALLGRDDGNFGVLRDQGERTVHREHSMHAHQVQQQQVRRDEMCGVPNERES